MVLQCITVSTAHTKIADSNFRLELCEFCCRFIQLTMTNVSASLKWVLIVFNVLFAIAGGVLIMIAMLGHISQGPDGFEQNLSGVIFLYLIGAATMVLSIIGAYGAHKEKKWALIVFFTGLVVGNACLLLLSVTVSVSIPAATQTIENYFYNAIPLDEASQDIQNVVEKLQSELNCCGVFNGYQDWGKHLPQSCLCLSSRPIMDKCEKINGSQFETHEHGSMLSDDSDKLVYKEPCVPFVTNTMRKALNIMLGICFGFAIMAFIGMAMSMTLLCQMRRQRSPVSLSMNPSSPPYEELHNASEN
ncbi:tetraspanin-8-like [Megalops cyprinoides]|uniref:tetraspanin-8-like n=1 Tax=Megalops cyprinoides TaxID=118141 RepID=UPI001863A8B9|nr:tetraspanin-8-like [Megalops cyprinoides]